MHFGNPEAKRRAEENPDAEGWKGVPDGNGALKGRGGEGDLHQPRRATAAVASGNGGGGFGADVVMTKEGCGDGAMNGEEEEKEGGSNAQQQPGAVKVSDGAVGAPGGAVSATAGGPAVGNACASGEQVRDSAAAVPGDANESAEQRSGEDDEAFMVSSKQYTGENGEVIKLTRTEMTVLKLY